MKKPANSGFCQVFGILVYSLKLRFDLHHFVSFDDVAHLDIIKSFDVKTTFVACSDFFHVVLEAPQRAECPGMDYDAVADHAHLCVAGDLAVKYIATCNGANPCDLEDLAHFDVAHDLLFEFRCKHAFHGRLDLVDSIVNDGIQPDIDLFNLRKFPCAGTRPHLESHDDGV